MKKFLKNLLVFFSILIIVIVTCTIAVKYNSNFKIDRTKSIVVLGHSHSECAFNDQIIKNLKNLSRSGESYFYNFYKLREVLAQNPHIETVFIEYSNLDFIEAESSWIWGEEKMSEYFPQYSLFMDSNAHGLLYHNNPEVYKNSILPVFKNAFHTVSEGMDYRDKIGGYRLLNQTMKSTDTSTQESKELLSIHELEIAEENLFYLRKIIALSRSHRVGIYLVRSPLHPTYAGYRLEKFFKETRKEHFSDVKFLDFSRFPLTNVDFADPEHLNHTGAEKFSKVIQELLNDQLLEAASPQKIIDLRLNKI